MAKQKPVRRPSPESPSRSNQAANPAPVRQRKSAETKSFFAFRGDTLLFERKHFIIMLAGIALILLGFILMSGGQQPNANTWDDSIIYSTRIITIAPIVILIGIGLQIYAIFLPGSSANKATETKVEEATA